MSAGGASYASDARPSEGLTAPSSPHSNCTSVPSEPSIGVRRIGPASPFHEATSTRSPSRPCAAISAVIVSGSTPAWLSGRVMTAVVPATSLSASAATALNSPEEVTRLKVGAASPVERPEIRIGCAPPDQAASTSRESSGRATPGAVGAPETAMCAATVMPKVYGSAKRARISR